MANKLAAVFLMCSVVFAAVQLSIAESPGKKYKTCFEFCEKDCKDAGNGYTFCGMKWDGECAAKESADYIGCCLAEKLKA